MPKAGRLKVYNVAGDAKGLDWGGVPDATLAERGYGGVVIFGSNGAVISATNPLPTQSAQPAGTDITAASGNQANANAVATLPGVAAKTTYITGFEVTATGSTAALIVLVTVTGVITGTLTYVFVFPAGVTTPANTLTVEFSRPIPASGQNTAIVVTLPAGGAGNTNAAVVAHGFQQ